MSTPTGDNPNPYEDASDDGDNLDQVRERATSDIEMTRLLRNIANEAHADRRRYFVITMSVVFGVFAFRQFIPPVWTLWM